MPIRTRKLEAPRRGQTSSQDYNDFQDEVIEDLGSLDRRIESNTSDIVELAKILFSELEATKALQRQILASNDFKDRDLATQSGIITAFQDFRSFSGVQFTGLSDARRMRLDPRYGQVLLPFNRSVSRFFVPNIESSGVSIAPNLVIDVTAVDEGSSTDVISGTPRNAVNGNNQEYWIRTVEYPLDSDKTSVKVQILISVPDSFIDFANILEIHPYPLDQLNITGIWVSDGATAPDAIDANKLPGFTDTIEAAGHTRIHFQDRRVTHLLVELEQPNWIERDGKKIFQYGAQEINLQLVEFDQTTASHTADVDAANGIVTVFEAPTGFRFDQLVGFFASPTFKTVSASPGEWPVFHRIYTDAALTNKVWDSFSDQLPQDLTVDLSSAALIYPLDKIYVLTTASFDTTRGVSPTLVDIGLQYKTAVS